MSFAQVLILVRVTTDPSVLGARSERTTQMRHQSFIGRAQAYIHTFMLVNPTTSTFLEGRTQRKPTWPQGEHAQELTFRIKPRTLKLYHRVCIENP